MANFSVREYLENEGILILNSSDFDFDSFPVVGQALVDLLSARIIEKQTDADIHTWLLDFDEQRFFLKAEHYSQALWLEALQRDQSREELQFIARLISKFA